MGISLLPGAVFAGRTGELSTLAQCAQEAAAGRPWLVVVEGEAGIGKTALDSDAQFAA
jgi:predicted ATPase